MNAELTAAAIAHLAEHGYCVMPGLIDGTEVERALAQVRRLAAAAKAQPVAQLPRLDAGQETVYNLQNKALEPLQLLLGEASVRAVLMHFLNDRWHRAIPLDAPNYILRSFSARNNLVASPMHIDSFIPYRGEHALSMQVSIVLEAQSRDNGCTLVVPGSHQSGDYVRQEDRARALALETAPGDVVVWDSRIWHGTGDNPGGGSRWSLIATFVRWWVKQGYRITESLPQDFYERLDDSARAVLGFCSLPQADEYAGVDFKTPYASLRPRVDDYRQ